MVLGARRMHHAVGQGNGVEKKMMEKSNHVCFSEASPPLLHHDKAAFTPSLYHDAQPSTFKLPKRKYSQPCWRKYGLGGSAEESVRPRIHPLSSLKTRGSSPRRCVHEMCLFYPALSIPWHWPYFRHSPSSVGPSRGARCRRCRW